MRDYGEGSVTIWDAVEGCEHDFDVWEEKHDIREETITGKTRTTERSYGGDERRKFDGNHQKHTAGQFCSKCGAWRGQLGLEPTLELYIKHLLQITAELKRVLKPTGVLFWNHGDSYGGAPAGGNQAQGGIVHQQGSLIRQPKNGTTEKCMNLQNYRLVMKMVDEQGWILRNVNIWNKPNHMPSSVKDWFSNGYEPIFMLVKNNKPSYYWNERTGLMADNQPSERIEGRDWEWREVGDNYSRCDIKIEENEAELLNSPRARKYRKKELKKYSFWHSLDYWFDLDAVREPHSWQHVGSMRKGAESKNRGSVNHQVKGVGNSTGSFRAFGKGGKNPGDVWTMNTQPFPDAHFAVFPDELPERCIKCGCPSEICVECGKARVRITSPSPEYQKKLGKSWHPHIDDKGRGNSRKGLGHLEGLTADYITTGWTDCDCGAKFRLGIVLDPFLGSGTTMKVARKLGMSCIGIEITPEYVSMIKREVRWGEGFLTFNEVKA